MANNEGTTTIDTTTTGKSRSKLTQILKRWDNYAPVRELCRRLQSGPAGLRTVTGLAGSSEAFLIRSIALMSQRPILVITDSSDQARDLYDDLSFLMDEGTVGHFPARQLLPYAFRAPVGESMGRRISTLARLSDGKLKVAVCPIRAVLEPTIYPDFLREACIDLN
ncbi:MAG: hypothetical protein AB1744_14950, partial [Candidatus Zixiibacteriota bacterium]